MSVKKLSPGDLSSFLDDVAGKMNLVAPVKSGDSVRYAPASGSEGVVLDYVLPDNSIKDVLFPADDPVYKYRWSVEAAEFEPIERTDEKTVVFGVRPCDLAAIDLLDQVFTGGDFGDVQYQNRRENTMMIGLGCLEADPSCICRAFEVTPGSSRGADVMMYRDEDGYLAHAVTEKGRELLSSMPGTEVGGEDLEAARERSEATEVPRAEGLSPQGLEDQLMGRWDSPYWEQLSLRCLSCGTCTFVCPTCHCFMIADLSRGQEGLRFKRWDSCQYKRFVLAAGDHNPRPTRKERIRQRFMHKLVYFPETNDGFLCTGCGRCVSRCPVDIHIAGVVRDMKEVKADAGS